VRSSTIIVPFGQLKSVEIVGTQIILHVASHQLQIFHQSSRMSHPFRIGFEKQRSESAKEMVHHITSFSSFGS